MDHSPHHHPAPGAQAKDQARHTEDRPAQKALQYQATAPPATTP